MSAWPNTPPKPPFKKWYRRGRRVRVVCVTGPPTPAVLLDDLGKISAKWTKHLLYVRLYPDDPDSELAFAANEDLILLDAD